ncbi:MAG: 1,4-dihydroxy-2-naphthoate octaprenyltransferase [Bacteroidetes bacterium]|nr:MAG: 1,4-dihydroxy-2-naphthoate octaprenyltransferase [Bacteroidota bacterium]
MKTRAWISALRLRTLPLALASIGMGSFLAAADHVFKLNVLIWAGLTTVFLQILSNLANDYGDSVNGADSEHRVGPTRAVQSGIISAAEMKVGIIIFILLSFVSGIRLLSETVGLGTKLFYWFLGFGVLSIVAAYTYTAGKRPYGYAGLGDIMVLIFFGILGVGGSYFLYALQIEYKIILPAISMGALATGVLNINNIRDIDSDIKAGKNTIPVRFGQKNATTYHWLLIIVATITAGAYIYIQGVSAYSFIWLLGLPLLFINGYKVATTPIQKDLDPYLKHLALSTLLFMITFGLAIVL